MAPRGVRALGAELRGAVPGFRGGVARLTHEPAPSSKTVEHTGSRVLDSHQGASNPGLDTGVPPRSSSRTSNDASLPIAARREPGSRRCRTLRARAGQYPHAAHRLAAALRADHLREPGVRAARI